MALYRIQYTILTQSGIAADYATNTFYFDATDASELLAIEIAMQQFYTDVAPQMSTYVKSVDNITFKAYDMADPEPRVPIDTGSFNVPESAQPGLPAEVAMVISFQGAKVSGVPQARKRGRVYIPFLSQATIGTDARPNSTVINALVDAADDLLTASDAATDWTWVVYSPTANASTPVVDGWVDNEWDTQRRRGRVATARTTFT